MNLWLSAEVQHEVSEPLRRARIQVQNVILPKLAADYGADVQEWAMITIQRPRIPEGGAKYANITRTEASPNFG